MAFLYILQSETTGRFYVGSTPDLQRRLAEHLRGHALATRSRGPCAPRAIRDVAECAASRIGNQEMEICYHDSRAH
jgi:predicted GIY-YIG superfamily endonuclease